MFVLLEMNSNNWDQSAVFDEIITLSELARLRDGIGVWVGMGEGRGRQENYGKVFQKLGSPAFHNYTT